MQWVQRWLAQIQAQLGELTVSQKLLIGMLVLLIPAMLWIVVQYASEPRMVPLLDQSIEASQRAKITAYLDNRAIEYRAVQDRILVPPDKRMDALAALQMQQMLPDDTSQGFDKLVERQTWWQSSEQNQQLYQIAKQKVLGRVLSANSWVANATVIISRPVDKGFGATSQRPTASVNLVTEGDGLDRHKVNAVAGLVSGAVAEMQPEDVTVIDAVAGRQWNVRSDQQMLTGSYLETIRKQERYYHDKIASALSYVPDAIVAVNVKVDPSRQQTESTSYNREESVELLKSERSEETQDRDAATGGEPGVRANTGMNIADGSGGGGTVSTSEQEESEFEPFAGKTHKVSSRPSGVPTRISATVNLPRSFFVRLYRQQQGDGGGGAPAGGQGQGGGGPQGQAQPTDQQLQPVIEEHRQRIQEQVTPLVDAEEQGEVVVDVYPDGGGPAGRVGRAQMAGPSGALAWQGYIKPVTLGVLALVSIGLMLFMVRRAAQRPASQPTAEELAGVPPSLSSEDGEMVGEAGEVEPALQGMELDEDELRQRKITEQVSEMINKDPEEVGLVFSRLAQRNE